jgi:hypothetical protein
MKKTTTLSFLRSMNLNVRREGWTLQTKFKIRTAADADGMVWPIVGYGDHSGLWTQPSKLTVDSIAHDEIAGLAGLAGLASEFQDQNRGHPMNLCPSRKSTITA